MAKIHKQTRIVHEVNSKGQHRIVIQRSEPAGIVQEVGDWAEHHEIATYRRYYGSMGYVPHLPRGIFTIGRCASQLLMP